MYRPGIDGREVTVICTCGRCGNKRTLNPELPADPRDIPETWALPFGWQEATQHTPLLCFNCKTALTSFLREDAVAVPLNISPQTAAAMKEMERQSHGFSFDEDDHTPGLLEED